MPFELRGPKGGVIVRRASAARVKQILPALRRRFGRVTVSPAEDTIRDRIVAVCRWGIAHERDVHYRQARPMPLKQKLPLTTDCSGFATLAYKVAGAPDPNGAGYDGSGYTGTMLAHCRHISKHDAKAGDLVVFGPGSGHHVVVLLDGGDANRGDPLVCSHGQERGPIALRLSDEAAAQPSPVTFLTVFGKDPL